MEEGVARDANFSSMERKTWIRSIWLCLILGMTALPASGSIPEDPDHPELWVSRIDRPDAADWTGQTIATSRNDVFVAAPVEGPNGSLDFGVFDLEPNTGRQRWAAYYDGPPPSQLQGSVAHDIPAAIGVSPDGLAVFVTGSSDANEATDGFSKDFATVAFDAITGTRLWIARFDGESVASDERALAIAISPDGSTVFVTGFAGLTIAYDSRTGAQRWVARCEALESIETCNDNWVQASTIAVSPSGGAVYVTGRHWRRSGDSYADSLTLALDASTGRRLWSARYAGPADSAQNPTASGVSQDGSSLFVTAASTLFDGASSTTLSVIIAYDTSTGAQRWISTYDVPDEGDWAGPYDVDLLRSLAVDPGGRTVFVTGSSYGPDKTDDLITLAYDSRTGGLRWSDRFVGSDDSNLVEEVRRLVYPEPWSDNRSEGKAMSIGISPDGSKVFVTGFHGARAGAVTVAYEAHAGDRLWIGGMDESSWHGRRADMGISTVVSPDGTKVFIAGYADSTWNTKGEYITSAYRAATCESGVDEVGPVSGLIRKRVEPETDLFQPYVHGANCELASSTGF
jgi:hypothetical protein